MALVRRRPRGADRRRLPLALHGPFRPPLGIALDHFFLRIPHVGEVLALTKPRASPARWDHDHLARTAAAGLESARAVVGNRYLRHQLEAVIDAVRSGAGLSASLAGVDKFPPLATQMIGVGEEVGKVDVMLLRVASMFERQTQRSIERVMGLVTPVLTILIAVVVGGLIMTVMDAVLASTNWRRNSARGDCWSASRAVIASAAKQSRAKTT